MARLSHLAFLAIAVYAAQFCCFNSYAEQPDSAVLLRAELSQSGDRVEVRRAGDSRPVLVQVANPDHRPYIHPLAAPNGSGVLTEFKPKHHPHQTGLFWGFTDVNGRDFFHNPGAGYWRRVSVAVLKSQALSNGDTVQWQTVYDLLDEDGSVLLRESQIWSLNLDDDGYVLDLQWTGDAEVAVTVGEYDYGGLFLRMPWRPGVDANVNNSARQSGLRAEGQRAVWLNVDMPLPDSEQPAHVAIFDHPGNPGFPQPWRVDSQMGVGPVRARLGDWTIDAGKSASIRHRLVVYEKPMTNADLTERWTSYSGAKRAYAQWLLAREEGRKAKFLTPQAAVDEMTIGDEFQVNVFASEPMITQPMAFCWDDAGRMWIAENRDYVDRRQGFSGSGDSRVCILEDTDGDGVADTKKVFVEGIPFPAAIAVGMGGLWLGAPPNLLFLPDADKDDRADMDQAQVRLTGWGIRDRHETLNSLHWGPDGWLYGLQGYATPSTVGKPAGDGRIFRPGEPFPEELNFSGETEQINGGVWRYHPTKERFEVVAHGFSNPWGIDYDKHGQLFITACVIPHLWHVIPGGIYHRQGGTHFNPYVYKDIQTIADHRHRSAHGGARIYQSDAFPAKYQDRIFMANIHEHAVLSDVLERNGSGFVGRHGDDFLLANNAQWVGFSIEIGPEGGVYVLDWHDADICGSDVLNKETGRVFRITPRASGAESFPNRFADLTALDDAALAALQSSESNWHARRARVILQHRATEQTIDEAAIAALRGMLADRDSKTSLRLRAMWALHVIGELDHQRLIEALDDDQEYIRGWAIQLLCEDRMPPADALAKFLELAKHDPSPVVRLYLASALQRLDTADRWPLLNQLVLRAEDRDDHNLPKMLWFATEPLVEASPDSAVDLALASQLPLITRHVARRFCDAGMLGRVAEATAEAAEGKLEPSQEHGEAPMVATSLLLGMRDSLDGRYDVSAPENWDRVQRSVEGLGATARGVALQLSQQFGDRRAAAAMLATLNDPAESPETRRRALEGLAGQKHPALPNRLVELLDDPPLRKDAIRAMASFDDKRLTDQLLKRYATLTSAERLEAVLALASRSESGRALTAAIRRGDVPRQDIPAYVARLLQRVVGNGFVEVWGAIDSLDADKQALFAKYRELLKPNAIASADPVQGRSVFDRTCYACHKLYGQGGNVGPDITGANRGNLDYLLGNILTPSAEIQDAYRMQIVLTNDGRIYSGIPAEENERQLKLRVANQDEPVTIAKSSIESRQVAATSMMPDGILNELSDREVRDLFAYLQTKAQVPVQEDE